MLENEDLREQKEQVGTLGEQVQCVCVCGGGGGGV